MSRFSTFTREITITPREDKRFDVSMIVYEFAGEPGNDSYRAWKAEKTVDAIELNESGGVESFTIQSQGRWR